MNFGGILYYIINTLKGQTKPNRVTWLLWAVAPLIATAAALSDGVTWAVLPVFIAGFISLLVLAASFINKNAYWKLGRLDYICGLLSVLALVLWDITEEPNVAIALAIASDGIASFPTLIKSWKYPETETASTYFSGLISALTIFAAVKIWDFSSLAFPLYLVIMDSMLVLAVERKKIFKINAQQIRG